MSAFAELLWRRRLTAGLSQQDLAERSGLSERAIRDLERAAVVRPRRSSVSAIATALGMSGDELSEFLVAARPGGPVPGPQRLGPRPPDGLVGRAAELRALVEAAAGGRQRLVTVTGPSGVGKSRLAAEAVGVLRGRRLGRDVRTLDLSGVRDPDLVAELIAEALGCPGPSRLAPVSRVVAELGARRVFLVLDCFERVLAAGAVVSALVERCPGLSVVVTSQRPLRSAYERRIVLPPLPDADAAELFRRRAALTVPGFTADVEAVAAVCRRLGGLPLAVELAAARMRVMSPAELAGRLDRRLRVLAGGGSERPARHRSLRAAIEAGLESVDADARELFGWLGTFRDGVALTDLEAVAEALGRDPAWPYTGLGDLVDTSLVRVQSTGETTRYALPDAMAELAEEMLAADPDGRRVHRAVAARYLSVVRTGLGIADAANLRAAVDWAARHDVTIAAGTAEALLAHHERSGRYADGMAQLLRLAEAGLGGAWTAAGRIALLRGDLSEGTRCGSAALAACAPDDHAGRSRAHLILGTAASELRDAGSSRRQLRAALASARRAGDLVLLGRALNNLGVTSATVGRLRDAERQFAAALVAKRRSGAGPAEQGRSLHNLAELARDCDRPALAAERAAEAAELLSRGGHRHPAALAASTGALELSRLGEHAAAVEACRRAVALLGDPGDDRRTAVTLELRASVVHHAAGNPRAAAAILCAVAPEASGPDHRMSEELAEVLVAHAAMLDAPGLLGLATALFRRTNRVMPRSTAALLEATAARCGTVPVTEGDAVALITAAFAARITSVKP